jgi:DNA-directed RNA polymerase subunit RPC12/RpoP
VKISEHSVKIIDGVEHRNIVPKYVVLDSPEEYQELEEKHFSMCIACGTEYYGLEPQAPGYACDACGSSNIVSLAILLVMGRVV